MKDTLREQIKACVSLATFKHNTALNDAGFQMDIDAIVDQILSLIEEEKIDYDKLATMIAEKIMNQPLVTLNSKENK